jgi:hypothetical protein
LENLEDSEAINQVFLPSKDGRNSIYIDEKALSEYNDKKRENELMELSQTKSYKVEDYDEMCEEYSKITEIIPLRYSTFRIIVFCILNLLSAFLISLLLVWFPKLKIIFLYIKCTLSKAKFVGIFGTGNKF